MNAPLDQPEARQLQKLLDLSDLRALAMRYARAIDRRDRDLLLTCYHPDAIDHHGNMFRGGPIAYADWQPQVMAPFELTAHYIVNTDYRLDGDKAEGELYFVAYHRTVPPGPRIVTVGGRYLDRYERREGSWRIAHRTLVWDFVNSTPLLPEDDQLLRSLGTVGSGPNDVSYTALPLFRG